MAKEPTAFEIQKAKDVQLHGLLVKSKTESTGFWKRIIREGTVPDALFDDVRSAFNKDTFRPYPLARGDQLIKRWGLLCAHVFIKSKIPFNRDPVVSDIGLANNTYVYALKEMAEHHWIRDIKDWVPSSYNIYNQFISLCSHLFCKYKMPEFLATCFFAGKEPWYFHLANGGRVQDLPNFPVMFTKKMAHIFMNAPAKHHIYQAIRYAQIKALDGDTELLNKVLSTKLGRETFHPAKEDFYETVYQFYINNPMLDRDTFQQVYDFIEFEKFVGDRVRRLPPTKPDFSMKGRTPEALLRLVDEWHGTLAARKSKMEWESCNIPNYFREVKDEYGNVKATWEITELLNSVLLREEGQKLKHCVGSYSYSCSRGSAAIYSLTLDQKKLITIEIEPRNKMIRQVRGMKQRPPTPKENQVIRSWASQNTLRFSTYL